jgi:hypothetical protein
MLRPPNFALGPDGDEVPLSEREIAGLRELFQLLDTWDRQSVTSRTATERKTSPKPIRVARGAQKGACEC